MNHADDKRDWRGYASWGSLLCGILSLIFTIAITVYIEFGQKHTHDAWEARYFFLTAPMSFLGIILGTIGKLSSYPRPRLISLYFCESAGSRSVDVVVGSVKCGVRHGEVTLNVSEPLM